MTVDAQEKGWAGSGRMARAAVTGLCKCVCRFENRYFGWNVLAVLFAGITQGILVAGASVYVNQLVKQSKGKEEKDR